MNKIKLNEFQSHPFHLVEPSPWPILVSFSLLSLTTGAVMYMHGHSNGNLLLTLGLILTVSGMVLWFKDIITEGTYEGHHTKQVQTGLIIGVVLFIVSEIFAFFSVFWAFFYASLAPAIEIGGVWPPLGISPMDPFSIPLLNTFLLLSSGAFVTYGHHALIAGDRKGAIIGTLLTIILAIIFTALQYYEYSEAGFTIADSVFGTVFFASTGLHGLNLIAPTKFILQNSYCKVKKIQSQKRNLNLNSIFPNKKNNLLNNKDKLLIHLKNKTFYLEKPFLDWLSGFTDAEGNFNISLRNLKNNKYNSLILTFQIGLHIDDLNLLKFIKQKLNCGHISISGSRCNYFVNDQISLIQVILPIFNYVKLNSSKYFQYLIFEKAVSLIKNKKHLSSKGKLDMIKYYYEIKKISIKTRTDICITDY